MKSPDLNEIDDKEILICLNCLNVDTAERNFKDTSGLGSRGIMGVCCKCSSKAFEIYTDQHYSIRVMRKVLTERI